MEGHWIFDPGTGDRYSSGPQGDHANRSSHRDGPGSTNIK